MVMKGMWKTLAERLEERELVSLVVWLMVDCQLEFVV